VVVKINVDTARGQLSILVTDDGAGLRADMATAKGNGIKNMHARATRLGGSVLLADAVGHHGTQLHLTLPCPDMRVS
jgi:signal transduction histidine kinase